MKISLCPAVLLALAGSLEAQIIKGIPPDILVTEQVAGTVVTDDEPSRALALFDVDGDDDLDVFVANLDAPNTLYLNDGGASFTRADASTVGPIMTDVKNSRGVAVGDIDGDGDVDVFVANSLLQTNDLYVNQGGAQGGVEGVFEAVTKSEVVTDVANSRQADFVDVDGDGDLDLFVANFNDQDNFLYINQGGAQGGTQGEFAPQTVGDAVADGGTSYDCTFADIDADGDLDLYVSNHDGVPAPSGGEVNFLYVNDGAGVFTRKLDGGDATVDVANSLCCGFGDFDGDGDADLFVGNDEFDANRVYANDGAGVFTAVPAGELTINRGESIGCMIGDVDLDGDLDVMLANRFDQPNVIYLNDGSGVFAPQTFGPLVENRGDTYDVAIGDLDGDLVPDIVSVNLDRRNYTYWNHGRQWSDVGFGMAGSDGVPYLGGKGNLVPGEEFRLRINDGAPNALTSFVAGFTTVFLPVKGGVLVPAPQVQVTVSTNATGSYLLKTSVPAGLPFGTEITVQAWLADSDADQGFAATNAVTIISP